MKVAGSKSGGLFFLVRCDLISQIRGDNFTHRDCCRSIYGFVRRASAKQVYRAAFQFPRLAKEPPNFILFKYLSGAIPFSTVRPSSTLVAMNRGTFVEPTTLTVGEYLDRWLHNAARGRLRERTFADYSELLKRYVRPAIREIRLSDLLPLDIQGVYTKMQERDLSARTVRYTHAVLTSALKQAVKWLMHSHNPAAAVDLPKATRKEMKALSAKEAERFLSVASEDRCGIVFALALTTGTRLEEYLALQWKDIDLGRDAGRR